MTRTKAQIENKIAELKKEIESLESDIINENYLDYQKCKKCGGSGWWWGGYMGQYVKYCTCTKKTE